MRFKRDFNLGGELAESDPLLKIAFFDNGDFASVARFDDPHFFIVGRTGSGKSALFEILEASEETRVARVLPSNLSLHYLTNLDVVRRLTDLGVHLEPFYSALWKHVIIVEILRHRYGINSPQAKSSLFDALAEKFTRDPVKRQALEYLNTFGDNFWCEADERIRHIVEKFEDSIQASGGLEIPGVGAKLSGEAAKSRSTESSRDIADRYQKVVNELQLPRLNQMIEILGNEIIDQQHRTYLVIDDLDRDWAEDDIAKTLIRCLFQAVVDMQRVKTLKIVVALRTNIFQQLNYGAGTSRGQDEKFRALALNLQWTRADLKHLLEQRAAAASKRYRITPPKSLGDMLPAGRYEGQSGIDYILDRTLLRPRDAIVYMNVALRHSTGKERITWDAIREAEREYSEDRLFALRDEWNDPYPGLLQVLEEFRGAEAIMDRTNFTNILQEGVLLMSSSDFVGTRWITELCHQIWESNDLGWEESYGPLTRLLFSLGFVGLSANGSSDIRFAHDDPLGGSMESVISPSGRFAIHPMFRKALEIEPNIGASA